MTQDSGSAQRNFTIVPNGVLAADINASALKVYLALRSYLRPGHNTFPHGDTVCEQYNIPKRTFAAALKELQAAGLLVIEKKSWAGGMRRSNSYFFPDVDDPAILQTQSADIALREGADSAHRNDADSALPIEVEKVEKEKVVRLAHNLPDTFTVTEEMLTWARDKVPVAFGNVVLETEKFKAWHTSKGNKFKDWPAAWRNWMLNTQAYAERDGRQVVPAGSIATNSDWRKLEVNWDEP